MKKILIGLVSLLIIISVLLVIKYNKKDNIKYEKNIIIKVGDKIPSLNKYIDSKYKDKIKDINISWKDIKIKDNSVYNTGVYKGNFNYKNENYSIKLTVIDDVAPTIEGVKDIEIYVNDKIDLFKDIKIDDNSLDNIEKNVVGDYDLSKKGTYNLKYSIKDKSGNETTKDFKLIVKDKPIIPNSTSVGISTKGYKIEQKNGIYYVNGILIANKSYKLPSTYNPGGLLNDFMTNFNNMKNAAAKDGVNLWIVSGFRSYNTQDTLYNNYVARDGKTAADRYSARPGHSEHQSGLAADLNDVNDSFGDTKAGKWLSDNCWKYGFILRYPKGKEDITGYMYESWHFRYIGDTNITKSIYNNGNWLSLEEYLGINSNY